jgi:8-hydroxy-5-deazaflavin:NADPH oxidoreductase
MWMRIGIIGSGNVARTIADGALRAGHQVRLGARMPEKPELRDWLEQAGGAASLSEIEDAAEFGELLVNATDGSGSLEALRAAGEENLSGKALLDIANAGSMNEHGWELTYVNDDSLAEEIQREFPELRVVKALNTMHREVMTTPDKLPGDHAAFICGNDEEAKAQVRELLDDFRWKEENVFDLGDITAARAMEMFVVLWVRLNGTLDRQLFSLAVVRA